jgi:hypothetical protein
VDRRAAIAAVDDATILAWVRTDNYQPLARALAAAPASYPGFRPDLDLARGFDGAGFARDGSAWRAVRFQPFPGAFLPTNGSASDLFVRLPDALRRDGAGRPSRAAYQLNLALLEAAVTADDSGAVDRAVEPIDERLLGVDLDGDGAVRAGTTRIRTLPPRYLGVGAPAVVAHSAPVGTELLHSLRYLDPDAPSMMASRLKELRYARKVEQLDDWGVARAYAAVADEASEGKSPVRTRATRWSGSLTASAGSTRASSRTRAVGCGCRPTRSTARAWGATAAIGVTIDHGFALARKVPGADGWRPQDLRGLRDRPQRGHARTELATYFERVGGGDETRSNDELLARFFPDGRFDAVAVARAARGGDRDLAWLLLPSPTRALALDKAYLAVVREQSFTHGRDAVLAPIARAHREIVDDDTGLREQVDRSTGLVPRW